jgi:hypothetical protein
VSALIVFGALADPTWTATARGRATVRVVESRDSQVANHLRRAYRVVLGDDPAAAAIVVVGREYPSEPLPTSARVSTVTLPADVSPVRIERVDAPAALPVATVVSVDASVVPGPNRPRETGLSAAIDGVVVARAQHRWVEDEHRWHAALDIVPIGEPPWVVRLAPTNGRASDIVIDRAPRIAVTFFEPRPSWATTFVRRALERDARFSVKAVTRLGELDSPVVVVGGFDRLADGDATALDRFARERGGAIVLLPDERFGPSSPIGRILPVRADDRDVLLERASPLVVQPPLPRLAASEMLTFGALQSDAQILARTADAQRPVVWSARHGGGRVVVSGALDAWRFRADASSDFDRFWRAAIAGAALAVAPLVDVRVTPQAVRPGDPVAVRVRVHPTLAAGASVEASLSSGDVVRLWPDAEIGAFQATVVAPAVAGVARVNVAITNGAVHANGSAPFVVNAPEAPEAPEAPAPPLALLSASHDGIDTSPADLTPLDRWLARTVSAPNVRIARHPMRSVWWMLPLFACLSFEWWITSSRRRRR